MRKERSRRFVYVGFLYGAFFLNVDFHFSEVFARLVCLVYWQPKKRDVGN